MFATHEMVAVDDDSSVLDLMGDVLDDAGWRTRRFSDPKLAWEYIRVNSVPLVVTDWEMPGMTGLDLLFRIRGLERPPHVIILTGYGTIDRAVQALTHGAQTFIEKPFAPEKLVAQVREILSSHSAPKRDTKMQKLVPAATPIVESEAIRRVYAAARSAAMTDSNILLLGESGTGKEVLVDYIHACSGRAKAPIVKVNCGAIPDNLIESELFGHEKGAFTGADRRRIGRFEQANGGTLFLDEIGDLQNTLQVKLLRALQERVIERVGSEVSVPVNFRLVCATHRNLQSAVKEGTFREDLFYRINVIPLRLPRLRERREEIEPLAMHFLAGLNRPSFRISPDAIGLMKAFSWPGNVRQLRNAIEYAVVMCQGEQIGPGDLPEEIRLHDAPSGPAPDAEQPLVSAVKHVEARVIMENLGRFDWNVSRVAEELKISRSSLYERMKAYRIRRP
ncbi:MAG TPA: sigma-54 dependent transcriptional regulator [Planctomycetota bacterium]|nr:sigma-54 dependent transcriptional regulator [Planctomycetota bacterium]